MTANVPRLDYTGGGCPKLLLEPQRTNLVTYSEQFNNAAWVQVSSGTGSLPVVTANNAISPDGYTNADSIFFDAGAGTSASDQSQIYQAFSVSAGVFTASFYAKTESGTAQILYRIDGSSYEKITITNQWQRFVITKTLLAGTNFFELNIRRDIDEPLNASATIQIWGVQVEAGSYPTSYIPTLGASVTRVADAASKTGISALIGGTSGTIFFEIKTNKTLTSASYKQFFYYTDASASQSYMYLNGSNYLVTNLTLGNFTGSLQFQADTTYKVAIAYATNDFKLYVNGVEYGSSTSGTTINAENILSLGSYIGSSEFNEFVFAQYLHFQTRLSNTQLAELTTL